MKQTENFFLKLFEGTDKFDYKVVNENWQKIDDAIDELLNGGNIAILPSMTIERTEKGYQITTNDAKGSYSFEIFNGKTAYEYALDGGYTGTEEEFAANVALGGAMGKELSVQKGRIDELVAMRGNGNTTTYNFDTGGLIAVLKTNGTSAKLYVQFDERISLEPGEAKDFEFVPAKLAPMSDTKMTSDLNTLILDGKVTIHILAITEQDATYAKVRVTNKTSEIITTGTGSNALHGVGTYPLASISISELSDMRVDSNGVTYPTAGEAVRAQTRGKDFIINYDDITGSWLPLFDFNDLYIAHTNDDIKSVWLFNHVESCDCLVTKIVLGTKEDGDNYFNLYSAVGVFQFDDRDHFEKIAEPESGGSADGAVLYTKQALTDDQKSQARENIGAMSEKSIILKSNGDLQAKVNIAAEPILNEAGDDVVGGVVEFCEIHYDGKCILRNIGDGVYDNDVVTVGQLNTAIGDISAALDRIIELQEELISL